MHRWAIFIFAFSPSFSTYGQETPLPTVFLIGEYEQEYEQLGLNCNHILLTVCNDSMDLAYTKWMTMLKDLEEYALKVNFDINGLKLWINVYWNHDGTIRHIAYYPKPTSKNMDFEKLTVFFKNFAERYKIPLTHSRCFSHYGSASFPTYARIFLKKEQ